jgi:hypothetical protein
MIHQTLHRKLKIEQLYPLFLLLTIVPFTDKKRFSLTALFIHIYVNWNILLYGCCHANNITCKFYGSHFK